MSFLIGKIWSMTHWKSLIFTRKFSTICLIMLKYWNIALKSIHSCVTWRGASKGGVRHLHLIGEVCCRIPDINIIAIPLHDHCSLHSNIINGENENIFISFCTFSIRLINGLALWPSTMVVKKKGCNIYTWHLTSFM